VQTSGGSPAKVEKRTPGGANPTAPPAALQKVKTENEKGSYHDGSKGGIEANPALGPGEGRVSGRGCVGRQKGFSKSGAGDLID